MKKHSSPYDFDAPRFHGWLSVMAFLTGAGALATLIAQIGFIGVVTPTLHYITFGLAALFATEQMLALPDIIRQTRSAQRNRWFFVIALITLAVMLILALTDWEEGLESKVSMLAHTAVQTVIFFTLTIRGLRHQARLTAITLRPGWLLVGSFGLAVIVGTLLLKMPRAIVPEGSMTWVDALFTSTSAVCVTGLSIHNTAEFFTPTGQMILLALIQFGGLGIMTITFYMASALFSGISLHDRFLLGEMIAENRMAHVGETLRFIFLFTFVMESAGAVALFFVLPDAGDVGERIYQAVFHSISAFCNAGFSTFTNGLADDAVKNSLSLQVIITILTMAGGLGSLAVFDSLRYVRTHAFRLFNPEIKRPRLRVHTRVVLLMTALIIIIGWPLVYLSEYVIFDGHHHAGSWMTAFFKSGSGRTSGFNTVDMANIGPVTIHLLVLLMIIGGSPGGTAGGLRTTVVGVAILYLWNMVRSRTQIVIFHRRLPADIGPRALGIIVLATGWLFVNFAVLRQLQPETSDTALFFELVSAFSTVGLSLNLTPELTDAAKMLISLNMFVGRIGLFTFIVTLMPIGRKSKIAHPEEDVLLV